VAAPKGKWHDMAENGTDSKPLTAAQHKAIAALLVSKSIAAAAEQSGTPERTLWRWKSDMRFLAALHAAEGAIVTDATRRLLQLSSKAIDELEKLLEYPKAEVRLRAAGMVLDQLLILRDLNNTESRLAALETALYAKPDQQ
jgi:hypothetical protein